ncbi:hypothetical protein CR513_60737, partial [Mucuna pruriens]
MSHFSLLQFTNDALLDGDVCAKNLWMIKVILRSIELLLEPKVNFHKKKKKSSMYDINVDENFLKLASNFLYCNIDYFPFKFFRVPYGVNPRRLVLLRLLDFVGMRFVILRSLEDL